MFFITLPNKHIQNGGDLAAIYALMREKGFNTLEERPDGMTVIMREADKSVYSVYHQKDGLSFEEMSKINLVRGGKIPASIYNYLLGGNAKLFKDIIVRGGNIYGLSFYHKKVLSEKTDAMPHEFSFAPSTQPDVLIEATYDTKYEDENGVVKNKTWEQYPWTSNWQETFKEDTTHFYMTLSRSASQGWGAMTGVEVFGLTGGSNLLSKEQYNEI